MGLDEIQFRLVKGKRAKDALFIFHSRVDVRKASKQRKRLYYIRCISCRKSHSNFSSSNLICSMF